MKKIYVCSNYFRNKEYYILPRNVFFDKDYVKLFFNEPELFLLIGKKIKYGVENRFVRDKR